MKLERQGEWNTKVEIERECLLGYLLELTGDMYDFKRQTSYYPTAFVAKLL
jgi:BRCT domain type II-containing protein